MFNSFAVYWPCQFRNAPFAFNYCSSDKSDRHKTGFLLLYVIKINAKPYLSAYINTYYLFKFNYVNTLRQGQCQVQCWYRTFQHKSWICYKHLISLQSERKFCTTSVVRSVPVSWRPSWAHQVPERALC